LVEEYGQRIYWGDEMRYGTRTELKRRWTPSGHRPVCRVKIGYEFGYLYCLLCPLTGDLFCLMLSSMQKACFVRFLQEFAEYLGKEPEKTLVMVDGAGSHQANVLSADSPLRLEKLPPCSPELNPAERFFQELRKESANQVFETVKDIEVKLEKILQRYWKEPQLVRSLTSFPYIVTPYLS
jgi:transposase